MGGPYPRLNIVKVSIPEKEPALLQFNKNFCTLQVHFTSTLQVC
jgi:hypothetical protein